jgi:nucleoid DNA-binding protein
MIPKKPQVIIKQVAEELNVPQALVDDIVSFYYKEVRKNLSSLEHPKVNLVGLGDFIILKKSVDRLTDRYTNLSKEYNTDTFKNYHNLKVAESKLERLAHARKNIEEFQEKKKKFRDGRKAK